MANIPFKEGTKIDFDDEFLNEVESDHVGSSPGLDMSGEQVGVESGLDPFNLRDPMNAYLFLSDDVQDELQNPKTRKMKCQACGYEFMTENRSYSMGVREIE